MRRTSARRARGTLALVLALSLVAGMVAQDAAAEPPIVDARQRAQRLAQQVSDARAAAAALQVQILRLTADVVRTRAEVADLEARLLVAQRALATSQANLEAAQTQLNERAKRAFELLGPANTLAFLLGASSLADLADRQAMLDRVAAADAALATRFTNETNRRDAVRADLQRTTTERARLLTGLEEKQRDLDAAFVERQGVVDSLAAKQQRATRRVRRLEWQLAQRSGSLPFGRWAELFLKEIGAPACRSNLVLMVAWQANEFTSARWNPLATTHTMPGSTSFNSVGVQDFVSLPQGLEATRMTLENGSSSYGYQAIIDGLRSCADATTTALAIQASAWCGGCTNGAYVAAYIPIVEQDYERYAALSV